MVNKTFWGFLAFMFVGLVILAQFQGKARAYAIGVIWLGAMVYLYSGNRGGIQGIITTFETMGKNEGVS